MKKEAKAAGVKLTMLGEWHINVPGVGGPMEEMQARSHKAVVDGILANLKENRGTHFDPQLIDLFFENFDDFLSIREMYRD